MRSGVMKQAPTSRNNVQKLGPIELWSELEHKVLPRPSQLETLGMEETHLKSHLHLESQILQSFVKNCTLFFYRIAEDSSATLQLVL